MSDKSLSITDAIRYLKDSGISVSETKLRNDAEIGLIDFELTPGGHRRFVLEDVRTYLKQHFYKTGVIEQCKHYPSLIAKTALKIKSPDRQAITLKSESMDDLFVELMGAIKSMKIGHLIIGPGVLDAHLAQFRCFLFTALYNKKVSISILNSPISL